VPRSLIAILKYHRHKPIYLIQKISILFSSFGTIPPASVLERIFVDLSALNVFSPNPTSQHSIANECLVSESDIPVDI
jgi:hypothetical protein